MQARMNNPATLLPDVMPAIFTLNKAARANGVPESTLELVHLRVSQINGCSTCVYGGVDAARKHGVPEDKLTTVAVWREAPFFDDAERAALALAEAATRLADRPDEVSDEIWDAAADHYDEKQLASLILMIGMTNLFNRFNAVTRQPAGATWA